MTAFTRGVLIGSAMYLGSYTFAHLVQGEFSGLTFLIGYLAGLMALAISVSSGGEPESRP